MGQLYYYRVKIYKTPGIYDFNKDAFESSIVDVGLENEYYVIINDFSFTKLQKKIEKNASYYCINKPSISIRTNDKWLDNGVFYTLYSEDPVTPRKIKSEIQKKIDKDYKWLLSGVDLSIIK